jgi:hypothetical protein
MPEYEEAVAEIKKSAPAADVYYMPAAVLCKAEATVRILVKSNVLRLEPYPMGEYHCP